MFHGLARWLSKEFCEKLKFIVFEMWGLEWLPNVPKWVPWKSWCTKVLSYVGFAHGEVWRGGTTLLDIAWCRVLWKNEILGFWDVKVGTPYKCPQRSATHVLVHKIFESCGFCTWPCLVVWHDIARWLGGEFCGKLKFVVFEIWRLERPPNVPKWIP